MESEERTMEKKSLFYVVCVVFVAAILALSGFIVWVLTTLAGFTLAVALVDAVLIVGTIFVIMYAQPVARKIREIANSASRS